MAGAASGFPLLSESQAERSHRTILTPVVSLQPCSGCDTVDGRNLAPAATSDTSDAGGAEPFACWHVLHTRQCKIGSFENSVSKASRDQY